jgi:exodeoxyribonuclease VII large subunit
MRPPFSPMCVPATLPAMSLFEDPPGPSPGNAPEYTVSELSGAVKKTIEGAYGRVRVRGEVGRVSRPAAGHIYFDLKDDRSVIAAVAFRLDALRLAVKPEEGMEVIATGRLTTFPGQSKYQLVVDDIRPAGVGALMAMLAARKAALAAEGLFDPARKRPLPYLPDVIGVVTSPTGAVIRDILHRLRDRFPRRVLVWPVAVQGERCAPEVARAIAGFNRLPPGGRIPRPDLLIVARGGGSLEDLWGFNDEAVVRAAAASAIPLISAVGHETDTTLIDHAADWRAPTPTAAAEKAVPVRLDLLGWTGERGTRLGRGVTRALTQRRQRLADLARALPRPRTLVEGPRQRLDRAEERLSGALSRLVQTRRLRLTQAAGALRPALLRQRTGLARRELDKDVARLGRALAARLAQPRDTLAGLAARLRPQALAGRSARTRRDFTALATRLAAAASAGLDTRTQALAALERVRQSVGYRATLNRGYAVVRGDGEVVTNVREARLRRELELEFADGRIALTPRKRKADSDPGGQGSLF